jgi:hypothetical protein
MILFAAAAIFSVFVLIPINASSENYDEVINQGPYSNTTRYDKITGRSCDCSCAVFLCSLHSTHANLTINTQILHTTGLAALSLSNIPKESDRLFAPLAGIYLFSALAVFLLYETYKMYVTLRQRHLSERVEQGGARR